MSTDTNYGVLDPSLAIDSMRSNGYLSTDTALLELIDNAVDADASTIEVFCFEYEHEFRSGRTGRRVGQIGVLDNGKGMAPDELRRALRFGGGRREDRTKIGRFGFGLPNSSISQCNLTEIWAWQNAHTNAVRGYLNVEEISEGNYREVPESTLAPLPDHVARIAGELGVTGSYVQWSELGAGVTWKTGGTVIEHTAKLVGRVYRHYLTGDDPLDIVLHVVSPQGEIERTQKVLPNDPLYLMAPTIVRWVDEPMFQEYTTQTFTIPDAKGVDRIVRVRVSYSKPECRQRRGGQAAGNQPHGQDAARNQGVSIVRNGRELELADVLTFDLYRDRWLGCEIDFPADLDELFGVYNNKQGASNLTYYLRQFGRGANRSLFDFQDDDDVDPREPLNKLVHLAQWTADTLKVVSDLVAKQQEGTRSGGKRHDEDDGDSPEDRASKQARRRAAAHPTPEEQSEEENPTPEEEQRREGVKSLVAQGYDPIDAENIMSVALDKDRRVLFLESLPSNPSEAIFDVFQLPGARVEVVLNRSHRAYEGLVEILIGGGAGNESATELTDRIARASDNLKMLFAAWARVETEAMIGDERKQVVRVRNAWGRMADDYLRDDAG